MCDVLRRAGAASAVQRIIDSHVHVWSDGEVPHPWVQHPPQELRSAATYPALTHALRTAGVSAALVVQPAAHGYDHRYVSEALAANPQCLRGMCLANQWNQSWFYNPF